MELINRTKHKISLKWLKHIINSLGINPMIEICYADKPIKGVIPNYKHKFGGKYSALDGVFTPPNRVIVYCGKWGKYTKNKKEHFSVPSCNKNQSKFYDYTDEYVKWILLHELRHNFYETHPPKKSLTGKGEEVSCSKYANSVMGVRKRYNLVRYQTNAKK